MDDVRQQAQKLATAFSADYFRKQDHERRFPVELFDACGQAGLFGALIPVAYGGAGAGVETAGIVLETLNRGGADAAIVQAQMAICGTLTRDGSEEQKRRFLPDIASGKLRMLSVAATEPDSGAQMGELRSSARREGSNWIVSAQKVLISMAEHTDLMLLLARADEGATLFLIDVREHRDALQIHPIDMVAHRMTTTLFVDDLRLGDGARVGPAGGGVACLRKGFATRRVLAASECIGNGRFLLDRATAHAQTRRSGHTLIGACQGVQYPLAQAYAKIEAADLMRWDAIRRIDAGLDADERSALAKVLASEAAWEAARAAMTAFGGFGLTSEYHIERKLRECTVFVFNNLLWNLIAARGLHLPSAEDAE